MRTCIHTPDFCAESLCACDVDAADVGVLDTLDVLLLVFVLDDSACCFASRAAAARVSRGSTVAAVGE